MSETVYNVAKAGIADGSIDLDADTLRIATAGDYDQSLAKLNLSQRQVPVVVKLQADARTAAFAQAIYSHGFASALWTSAIAALLASVSGWLYAHLQRFVNPTPFSLSQGIEYLFMVVVGGAAHVFGYNVPWWRLAITIAAVVVVLAWALGDRTSVGVRWKAAVVNPELAESMGYSVRRARTSLFVIGCGVAGLAGALDDCCLVFCDNHFTSRSNHR